PPSLMVVAQPQGAFTVETRRDSALIKTARATATIAFADGRVRIVDSQGRPLLAEAAHTAPVAATVDGKPYYGITHRYNPATDEGFYGLGQHQNRQMNYNGEDVELAQHNMDIAVPFG